jgi:hypothetical protein
MSLTEIKLEITKKIKAKRHYETGFRAIAMVEAIFFTILIMHGVPPILSWNFLLFWAIFTGIFSLGWMLIKPYVILLSLCEVLPPHIQGRFSKFKMFVKVMIKTPDAETILDLANFFKEVKEKNEFEKYESITEFMKNMYDGRDKQNNRISELENKFEWLVLIFMHEFQKARNEYWTEKTRRIKADENEKIATEKLEQATRLIIEQKEALGQKDEEIKRLKDGRDNQV